MEDNSDNSFENDDADVDNDVAGMELSPLNTEDSDTAMVEEGAPPKERAAWDSKIQFLLGIIGYAVGLGNVWRFPYLCQQNGGGAFLIPYAIMLIVEGIPLFYLELAVGQRLRKGSIGVWNDIHPLLGGLGYTSAVVSYIVSLYYNVIIAWCLYYLFYSFRLYLPWTDCPTITNEETNITSPVKECEISDSTSYFWYRETLDMSPSIDVIGGVKWKMFVSLLVAWIIVYVCMCKGIKSAGKVMYVTATFPYVVLVIFFGRGVTLKGAGDGLRHMFTPKMEKLLEPQVWLDAATQIFYSLGLAFGGLIAFASYNKPKNNCRRDAILVSITNCSTSIFASIVIFSVLGFKAHLLHDKCVDHNIEKILPHVHDQWNETTLTPNVYKTLIEPNISLFVNASVDKLGLKDCDLTKELDSAAEGTGLAFIIFTQAIIEFPGAPFWSILFFTMLLMLGLGSQFGTVESVVTSIVDLEPWPWCRKKWAVSAVVCSSSLVIGIIFTTGAGQYWVKVFDSFGGTFPLMVIAFFEVVGVSWIYGMKRFNEDIRFITGDKPGLYWVIMWKYVGPIVMFLVLIASVISKIVIPVTYKVYDKETAILTDTKYPWWVAIVIAFLVLSSSLCIPVVAILKKVGIMSYDAAKAANIATGGTTQSTTAMLPDDRDSGNNSEEALDTMGPYVNNRRQITFLTSTETNA
ncbi:sodium-dependent neutral amino acid transporter B(0)AT3-like [Tubulanus polymorphus]|uniref:sodium-dependent neutral amino acid transporter B(0)AT3-like n=1 Tax=Tubulanus polymorphus TaxID=672921 RepID=UPI003DA42CC6